MLSLTVLLAGAAATAEDMLRVTTEVAAVKISPRPAGQNFVRLPTVEFSFNVEIVCRAELIAGSLSLSIADTRRNFKPSEITSAALEKITVTVPEKQIAPVPVDDFCLADDSAPAGLRPAEQMIVPHVMSAHASLLCAAGDAKNMTYVSRPLDVLLTCERQPEEDSTKLVEL